MLRVARAFVVVMEQGYKSENNAVILSRIYLKSAGCLRD